LTAGAAAGGRAAGCGAVAGRAIGVAADGLAAGTGLAALCWATPVARAGSRLIESKVLRRKVIVPADP
jgi:hypothetical protein